MAKRRRLTRRERLRRQCARVRRLHTRRRNQKRCINGDGRRAHKGGRCKECWTAKLAAERTAYAEKKARTA